jgi:ribosome-associated translation inhibitor RaiA
MQIQINTDHNIEGYARLVNHLTDTVDTALSHFKEHITRVEMHLSDQNSSKKEGKDDMRCVLEARLAGKDPLAVTHNAATTHQAVDGALDKLTRLLDSKLERQRDLRRRQAAPVIGAPETPELED